MKLLRRLVVLTLLVAVFGIVIIKHEQILDWAVLRNYQPPAGVQSLAAETGMTPYARRLFYVNKPAIENKIQFNQHCTDPSEQVAVLGCFLGNRMGIYLYDVPDERLEGIKQVTAAHEMLHQAYLRLSSKEKTRINGLLQQYHDLKATPNLKDKIDSYRASEPGNLQNEMHSIFGTEAEDLSPELEEYYKQYFQDRRKVIALYKQYQSEFDQRREQIKKYDEQLEDLKAQIETKKSDLEVSELHIKQKRAELDAYLASNQIKEYNAAVPGFNALVTQYKKDVTTINQTVDSFNNLLEERNALAVQERQLEDAIDSTITTAPKQ